LYGLFEPEEINALYHDTEEAVYDADQVIFNQGQLNTKLWFIYHGTAKIVYQLGKREFLLKTLGPGSIAGEDTFFSMATCSTSLIALSQVKLKILKYDVLKKWESEFPALENKLKEYCHKFEKIPEIIKKQGLERRKQKRVDISGKAAVQILDTSEAPIGKPVRGELSDLSMGGVCLFIKTSSQKSARLLLGRKLKVKFIFQATGSQKEILQKGTVVAVRYHLFNDYSVHIKFDNMLPSDIEVWIERQ